jgi:hypothetical protein
MDETVESSEPPVDEPRPLVDESGQPPPPETGQRGRSPHRRGGRIRVGDVRRRAVFERREALDTRDPIAIRYAGERYEVLVETLGQYPDEARIDPWAITVGVSQAAKMLGFNGREIRSLIRVGRLPARKQKNEWRIPLEAVL